MATTTESCFFSSKDLRFVDVETRKSKRLHIEFVESDSDRFASIRRPRQGKQSDKLIQVSQLQSSRLEQHPETIVTKLVDIITSNSHTARLETYI
jgi:hypothetical protein